MILSFCQFWSILVISDQFLLISWDFLHISAHFLQKYEFFARDIINGLWKRRAAQAPRGRPAPRATSENRWYSLGFWGVQPPAAAANRGRPRPCPRGRQRLAATGQNVSKSRRSCRFLRKYAEMCRNWSGNEQKLIRKWAEIDQKWPELIRIDKMIKLFINFN